ncbi:hypothetical protein BG006_006237 [Podila minutissima]|uniref:Uncharacterized protein n=1 Tax=Podila minutissima TaxID=64525 RepID=A0A9P5VLS2_9FUNG|nr:hypothetical protein BG006_006237 [Podila minutissima]
MTSQPLVASVCVDYLSHPLSAQHLLVCYQQITRQIAHAPLSAKDAATSFQHQSQTLLELLGQHQNLAIPKERPAPVGCQSQLRRMQNALWRRSSQSSLAKDVALVRPESLNWQKECDVLWLYGPLYEFSLLQLEYEKSAQAWLDVFDDQDQALAPSETTDVNEMEVMCPEPTTSEAPSSPFPEATENTVPADAQVIDMKSISPLATGPSELSELRISTIISHTESDSSSSSSPSSTSSMFRPQKSVLKQQGTRLQLIEELRCFATSPQYHSICNTLATFRSSTPSSVSGTRSEPLSPITSSLSAFVLPIFPEKHQYRSRDHRRASFPKSASHPNRLNTALTANPLSSTGVTSTKQLRFSLEVQELVFLPTSPPFRISRAKPTRAHSDPAIQTSTSSSFMAPSHPLPTLHAPSLRDRNLISTATAFGKENTTTFIKIQDRSSSSSPSSSSRSRNYGMTDEYEEEDELGISFDDDDYLFQDCVEDIERRQFVPSKGAVVVRRVQDEQHPRRIGPGVLWQVYTAVTGVKELIAWYGSMVYHSSSL